MGGNRRRKSLWPLKLKGQVVRLRDPAQRGHSNSIRQVGVMADAVLLHLIHQTAELGVEGPSQLDEGDPASFRPVQFLLGGLLSSLLHGAIH
jgi:hypothetical protein